MGNTYLSLTAGEIVHQDYETNMQNLNIAPSQHITVFSSTWKRTLTMGSSCSESKRIMSFVGSLTVWLVWIWSSILKERLPVAVVEISGLSLSTY